MQLGVESPMITISSYSTQWFATKQDPVKCVPAPHLLLHIGNSKVGGMINWCTLPRVTQPAGVRTRKNTLTMHWLGHTQTHADAHKWHRVIRSAPSAWATYQVCREIFGRWYIWASHPLIKRPSNPRARSADRSLTDYLFASPWISRRHSPIPPLFFSFFFLFLWLSILGVHIHTHAHTQAKTLNYNYLL